MNSKKKIILATYGIGFLFFMVMAMAHCYRLIATSQGPTGKYIIGYVIGSAVMPTILLVIIIRLYHNWKKKTQKESA